MAEEVIRLTEIAISSFEWTIPGLTSALKEEHDSTESPVYEFCDGPWRLILTRQEHCIDFLFKRNGIFGSHVKDIVVRTSIQISGGDIMYHFPEKVCTTDIVEDNLWTLALPWMHVGQKDCLKITLRTKCAHCDDQSSYEESSDEEFELERKLPKDNGRRLHWEKKLLRTSGAVKLQENMKKLLASDEDKDVTLNVMDRQFRAHRNILRARSPVFRRMFTHNMAEKNSGIIDISDCDPEVFEHFLAYLYTGELKDVSEDSVMDLYYIGDKYQVEGVKKICATLMQKHLSVETFCDVVTLSLLYKESEILEEASKFFVKNIREITATKQWILFLGEHPSIGNDLHILAGYYY